MIRWILTASLAALVAVAAPARTRYHQYTEQYHSPRDAARVLVASYLGGEGDEYLAGAAFLPDGGLALAGNSFGPRFELRGAPARTLGRDTEAPAPVTVSKNDKGVVKPLRSWDIQDGAGFVLLLSADYRRVERALRFPWNSGVITDVTADRQGAVYITGRVGRTFAALGSSTRIAPQGFEGADESFFARLKPDWTGFAWCVRLPDDPRSTPMLRCLDDGIVSWIGEHGAHFNADGRLLRSQTIGYPETWVRGVDFRTFDYATGGQRNTRTGYEPWIQPALHMFNRDGSHRFRLYEWDPKLVAMNFSRRVSDSAPHAIAFDRNGRLLVAGWSDGGNSVWDRVPFDLIRGAQEAIEEMTGRKAGLPFSTWGANVGSFAHLLRLDPETANPLNYTLFASYLGNQDKPNSVTVHMLDAAADNSLLISGSSAWGLIQTGSVVVNTLDPAANDYMGGDFIAILNEDWNDIRYSSAVPGAGRVLLKRRNPKRGQNFSADSIVLGGRTRVAFVTGAQRNDKFKPVNPVMPFGGGDLDGLLVVLEMDRLPPVQAPRLPYPTAGRRFVEIAQSDDKLAGDFAIGPGMRNNTCAIILRDTTGKQWPTWYSAVPEGEGAIQAEGRGNFKIVGAPNRVQMRGGTLQTLRVGGRADQKDFPEIALEIMLQDASSSVVTIAYNGRNLRKPGRHAIRAAKPVSKGSVDLRGVTSATRGELGLARPDSAEADEEILIEWWAPARPAGGTPR